MLEWVRRYVSLDLLLGLFSAAMLGVCIGSLVLLLVVGR